MRAVLPCIVFTLTSFAAACGGQTQNDSNETGTRADDGEPAGGSDKPAANGDNDAVDGGVTEGSETTENGSETTDTPEPNEPNEQTADTESPSATSPSATDDDPAPGEMPPTTGPTEPNKPPETAPDEMVFGPAPADAPPPMDCVEEPRTTSSGQCQLSLSCSNDNLAANCTVQPDGTYACSCSSDVAYGNYVLSGVDDTNACDNAVELCKGGNTLEFGTEATCQEPTLTPSTGACQFMQQCATSASLSDTVSVLLYDTHFSRCSDQGDGRLNCSCSTNSVSRDYTLTGQGLDTACQAGLELCTGNVMFDPNPMCNAVTQFDDKDACQLQNECGSSASVGDGVAVLAGDYQSSSCTKDGDWSCSCSTSTNTLSFQLAADQEFDDRCGTVLGVCTSGVEPEPSGETACETTSQTASGDLCNAQITCKQAATVGDLQINLLDGLSTSCQRTGEGVWNCACTSDTESVTYDVEGDSGAAACTTASTSCIDRLAVSLGTSSSSK